MDQIYPTLLKILTIVLLVRFGLSILTDILVTRKMKKAEKNAIRLDSRDLEMLKQKMEEQDSKPQLHPAEDNMVRDDYCSKPIEKSKAYIIYKNNQYHHFCSWECRQKYLENMG